MEGEELVFDGNDDVILKASAGELFCRSVFHTVSAQELQALHAVQSSESKRLRKMAFWFKQKNRVINYTRRIRERGLLFTIRYALEKAAKKLRGHSGATAILL